MTTRSGLVASPRKLVRRVKKTVDINSLLPCAITRPAPFSLKPYAGLFNPYSSKGCSVLCNHPTKMKNAWPADRKMSMKNKHEHHADLPDHVPEEFFRRYTDTDSRPLTPTPSCATSAKTRTGIPSSHLSTRRCVTPEPVSSNDNNERKQIILDLRRSHSQETLCWNASSEMQQDSMSSSWLQSQSIKHEIEIAGAIHKEEIEDIQELEEEGEHLPDYDVINDSVDLIDPGGSCINARDNEDENEFLSRRGKLRRKKSKTNLQVITFQPNNEPETQVAALPSEEHEESPNLSARPSLVPDTSVAATPVPSKSVRKTDDFYTADKSFFLDEDALQLRMGLNVEIVECVFDRYRHRTLHEVLRTISPEKMGVDSDAVEEMKATLNLPETDYETWMHLPRKFSRSSSRFEFPMDFKELAKLTPLTYLSKFVFFESDVMQLYHRIFVKYLPKDKANREENDNEEFFARVNAGGKSAARDDLLSSRCLQDDALEQGLRECLGFYATDDKIVEIMNYLELEKVEEPNINFRTFAGVVAFAERVITTLDQNEDPRNEIEIADFETLARHFDKIESVTMRNVLNIIQR